MLFERVKTNILNWMGPILNYTTQKNPWLKREHEMSEKHSHTKKTHTEGTRHENKKDLIPCTNLIID